MIRSVQDWQDLTILSPDFLSGLSKRRFLGIGQLWMQLSRDSVATDDRRNRQAHILNAAVTLQ